MTTVGVKGLSNSLLLSITCGWVFRGREWLTGVCFKGRIDRHCRTLRYSVFWLCLL